MRSDMMKVLCERPRRGGYSTTRKGVKGAIRRNKIRTDIIDFEEHDDYLPSKIGMKADAVNCGRKTVRVGRKSLNENLNPLWRFLHRNCGRPWSEVYSEMREVCDARSAIGYHIFQHALDSWGFGWVHDRGLTRENYHVPYENGSWGYERTLSISNKVGHGDFVIEGGVLYGPPIAQGIPVPKKLRNLVRTQNIRKHKLKKTKNPNKYASPEQTALAVEKMVAKKRKEKARRNFAKFMGVSMKTLRSDMAHFKVETVEELKEVLVRR